MALRRQPAHHIAARKRSGWKASLLTLIGCMAWGVSSQQPVKAITITINNFTDVYSVSNWTSVPGTGSINTSGAPNLIALTSGNNGSGTFSQTTFGIIAQGTGTISFRWRYSTSDSDGPVWDPFGYSLNSVFTQLTNDSGGNNQSATISVPVVIGDLFQFTQRTQDNFFGSATTRIDRFSAPKFVPAPAPALALVPLLTAVSVLRRRYRSSHPR
ncbi:hypothetical protein [Synechococcus sp. CS-1328]|uniref:hypothetical protein n=1 Tax=Synechococcus sp. CS-1328 TaxID=2847976 RepID=UPI00223AC47A|nr:hypothetical protein [Synechococcus sp. CS-1328]MCT0225931.1 hypothetical protein [Synechococcus sp. CS-1328]